MSNINILQVRVPVRVQVADSGGHEAMSSPTQLYPNLQTSLNQSQPSTPRFPSRMSMQSDGDFRDDNEFVFVAEGNAVRPLDAVIYT